MIYFPHDNYRKIQEEMVKKIDEAISSGKNLLINAPTGLGKTAAVLAPAFTNAYESDKTVFFLTSKHTQHKIAIDTLREIKKRHNLNFSAVNIIGKKWMCSQPSVNNIYSKDFSDFCKALREDNMCQFYSNLIKDNKISVKGARILKKITSEIMHAEEITKICIEEELCPYYLANIVSRDAKVIVTDYYYVFNPDIQEAFFGKNKKELEKSIIIVDEAHNLPARARELLSEKLTTNMLIRGIKEAKKYRNEECISIINSIQEGILNLTYGMNENEERKVSKEHFIELISNSEQYDKIIEKLEEASIEVREIQKISYLGSIAAFLKVWKGEDDGFLRYVKTEPRKITLFYNCLDPSIITRPIFDNAHSSILMSATLQPLEMYKELLGIDAETISFESPFEKSNRLNIILTNATTRFSQRSENQYEKIAKIISEIANDIYGNTLIFFPSYKLMQDIEKYFSPLCKKTIFIESQKMNKGEKTELLKKYSKYKDIGAVLLGVVSGNFAEGIDLPGVIKCIIIVGLPLQQPDLETKELIDYYDKKYGKGWEYGYVMPAFTKTFQAAGRCIRSEKDRGIIIFLDSRYIQPNYYKYFPKEWVIKKTTDCKGLIKDFFYCKSD